MNVPDHGRPESATVKARHLLAFPADHAPFDEVIGGEQVRPFEMVDFMAREGWTGEVWCLRPARRRRYECGGVRVRTVPGPRGVRAITAFPWALFIVLRAVWRSRRGGHPPVIYLRPGGVTWRFRVPLIGDAGVSLLWISARLRVSTIASIHDVSPDHEAQSAKRQSDAAALTSGAGGVDLKGIRRSGEMNGRLQRYAVARASLVFVTSSIHRATLLSRVPSLHAELVEVVPPGVRPSMVDAVPPWSPPVEEWRIGIPGSLWDTDFASLEEALRLLPDTHRFVVRFGGRGTEAAQHFDLPAHVRVESVPSLRYSEFPDFASGVDLFVLFWGGYFETASPLRVPMCVASGRPVVSTTLAELNQTGLAEFIELVAPEPRAVARTISRVIEAPFDYVRKGQEARTVCLSVASWDERFRRALGRLTQP
jgi:hypothetical protein